MDSEVTLPENFISWQSSVERVGGDEEFLVELLNDFRQMINDNLSKIQSYIKEKTFNEIRDIAHSMKGASGNLGLNTIYDTTLNMENYAKDQNLDKINEYYKNLEMDFNHLNLLLKK